MNAISNKRYSIEEAMSLARTIEAKGLDKTMQIFQLDNGKLEFTVSRGGIPWYRKVYHDIAELRANESWLGSYWYPNYSAEEIVELVEKQREQNRGKVGRWPKDAVRICQRCGQPETSLSPFAPKRFLHEPCLQEYNREKQRERRKKLNAQ